MKARQPASGSIWSSARRASSDSPVTVQQRTTSFRRTDAARIHRVRPSVTGAMKMNIRIGAALLLIAVPLSADLPPLTTTALSESTGYVTAVTPGPDGAVWFLDGDANVVGRSPLSGGAAT